MYISSTLLNTIFFGNSLQQYLTASVSFILLSISLKIFQSLILFKLTKIAESTRTDIDDTLIKIFSSIKPPFYSFVAVYFSLFLLQVPTKLHQLVTILLITWAVFQTITSINIVIDFLAAKYTDPKSNQTSKSAVSAIKLITKITLWCLATLLILSNLGFNISTVLASLGIGGIAVAMAAKNILSDLFSSMVIYLDKPFKIGDVIDVDGKKGTVKKIGARSTRIRSIDGGEIVIPNQKLTDTAVQNIVPKNKRRVSFELGISYQTPSSKLEKIPQLIKQAVTTVNDTNFDRAHLSQFGDSALIYEVVYHYNHTDFQHYMDAKQTVNLNIIKTLEKNKIEIAYPTQTVFLKK